MFSLSPCYLSGKLVYTIEGGNDEGRFSIDYSSGVISATEELDFETKPHYQLTVRATDAMGGGFAETLVLLGVEDVNDCRPRFDSESYRGSVSESAPVGSSVLAVSATDADSGANGEVEFSLRRDLGNSSDHFAVHPQTGVVTVRKRLDRELETVHSFVIVATDHGSRPLSAEAAVTVWVTDVNDNAPAFEEAVYAMRVSDGAQRGQFVGKVRAVDPDDDDHDQLRYAVVGGDDHQVFSMDERTGAMTLVNIHNFGQTSQYGLNITVTDGVFSSSCKATVSLVSANSFAPSFPDELIKVSLQENLEEGTLVARLNAFDEDRNDRVRYQVSSDEMAQLFRVDPKTGEVWSLKTFDREEEDSYDVPVVATDAGGRSGFATLRIKIEDENDCDPIFALSEYKANVFANQTAGSRVTRVAAEDDDEGENARLRYSLYENATSLASRVFSVDRRSGAITLREEPASLENQVFQFFVRAEDSGEQRSRHADVPVEVYMMSPLDRPPVFDDGETTFYLSENSPVGEVITQTFASVSYAERSGQHSRVKRSEEDEAGTIITYRLADAEHQGEDALFSVDPEDGRVSVSGHLDRERDAQYRLTVLAQTDSSPALVAYRQLAVSLLDVNDNPPRFDSETYRAVVSEVAEPGTRVARVLAADPDFGTSGEVRYSLGEDSSSPSSSSLFLVGERDGWITTLSALDREGASAESLHELVVVAEDGGGLRSSASVVVSVRDANDSPARFSQRHYSAAVNEMALPGTIIFQLFLEDDDPEATSDVELYIVEGDPKGQFQVSNL